MSETLKTDYLVAGAGAMGMAFVDTLLSETDADIIMVDRHAKPGGHWNLAYPFVKLHQPSAFFGVASRELSRFEKDRVGLNKGLFDLASGAEVSAYFDEVMQQRFLASGRVRYFPMCEFEGNGHVRALTTGKAFEIEAGKLVDATKLTVDVPSTHTPSFSVAEGVHFMPLNGLPAMRGPFEKHVVIGAGKTGIDACLWLLEHGVMPDDITWIMPRDAWMLPRENAQPDMDFFMDVFGNQAGQMESIAASKDKADMFMRLEQSGYFVRFDPEVLPSMFHAASISKAELEVLRRIHHVVRLGRVTALEHDRIVLEEGEIETSPDTLHIDCSASLSRAKERIQPSPVFEAHVITPQTVRAFMPVFSGSLIAYIEAHYDDEAKKNALCSVVPLPNTTDDFILMTLQNMMNQYNWSQEPDLRRWIRENRLDGFSKIIAQVDASDTEKTEVLLRMREAAPKAVGRLMEYAAEIG
ncbi:MAG: NAD(P)/FAD-dependent oxidoreductase [Parvibaculales bacterium]